MKRKTLRIAAELLVDFLRKPVPPGITAEGLPEDANIVDAIFDHLQHHLVLWIESSEFKEEGDLDLLFHHKPQ